MVNCTLPSAKPVTSTTYTDPLTVSYVCYVKYDDTRYGRNGPTYMLYRMCLSSKDFSAFRHRYKTGWPTTPNTRHSMPTLCPSQTRNFMPFTRPTRPATVATSLRPDRSAGRASHKKITFSLTYTWSTYQQCWKTTYQFRHRIGPQNLIL